MTDTPVNPRVSTRIAAIVLAVLVLLPALYVLSVGPVLWLIMHNCLPSRLGIIYHPLWHVCDWCEPLSRAVVWYVGRWID